MEGGIVIACLAGLTILGGFTLTVIECVDAAMAERPRTELAATGSKALGPGGVGSTGSGQSTLLQVMPMTGSVNK